MQLFNSVKVVFWRSIPLFVMFYVALIWMHYFDEYLFSPVLIFAGIYCCHRVTLISEFSFSKVTTVFLTSLLICLLVIVVAGFFYSLKFTLWIDALFTYGILYWMVYRAGRPPDLIIGDNYMLRWYVLPRNTFFNIYLHCFLADDDDRALHDHPWWSVSFLLRGTLLEHLEHGKTRTPSLLLPIFRSAEFAHRLELKSANAWTIFITGSVVRNWGFHCQNGWIPWREFTDPTGNNVGSGCGEVIDEVAHDER